MRNGKNGDIKSDTLLTKVSEKRSVISDALSRIDAVSSERALLEASGVMEEENSGASRSSMPLMYVNNWTVG